MTIEISHDSEPYSPPVETVQMSEPEIETLQTEYSSKYADFHEIADALREKSRKGYSVINYLKEAATAENIHILIGALPVNERISAVNKLKNHVNDDNIAKILLRMPEGEDQIVTLNLIKYPVNYGNFCKLVLSLDDDMKLIFIEKHKRIFEEHPNLIPNVLPYLDPSQQNKFLRSVAAYLTPDMLNDVLLFSDPCIHKYVKKAFAKTG